MTPLRKIALGLSACATFIAGAAFTAALHAQTFPTKPVTLMVPYPAGGGSDVLARSVNTTLGKELG
jgi:tripartite-type tricarboxylate transporter receptor subunit TctC